MSAPSCQIPLSIKVKNSIPGLFAYYKLEDAWDSGTYFFLNESLSQAAGNLVFPLDPSSPGYDSLQNNPYGQSSADPPHFVSGKIGNGITMYNAYQYGVHSCGTKWVLGASVGFSIRVWINGYFSAYYWPYIVGDMMGCGGGTYVPWAIGQYQNQFIVTFQDTAGSQFWYFIYPQSFSDHDGWHMVIFTYNAATLEIKLRVDGGATISNTMGHAIYWPTAPRFGLNYINFGGVIRASYYDEIAIYKEYILSDAEMDAEWNGGAGRTYPW